MQANKRNTGEMKMLEQQQQKNLHKNERTRIQRRKFISWLWQKDKAQGN